VNYKDMYELLVGDDSFTKYKYCMEFAEREGKIFRTFDLKMWKSFEEFIPELYRKTLFSQAYCVLCDFPGTLSKKKIEFLKENTTMLEESEDNFLFIGVGKSLKGFKKNERNFNLPKPWKDGEWKQLVNQLASEKKLRLTIRQVERLIGETENDLWKINNELNKFRMMAKDGKIDEDLFDEMFYSYSKESLQIFVNEFVDRKSLKALDKIETILLEYNQMQILYRLSAVYLLIAKIRMVCLSSNINLFTFNTVKEIAAKVKTNIPVVSEIVGFSFDRSEKKQKICFQYTEKELNTILEDLLNTELDFKSGKVDFRANIIQLFNKVHFEETITR